MGQIRGFFRSDFSAFGAWNLIWKRTGFVKFGANLAHFGAKSNPPSTQSPRVLALFATQQHFLPGVWQRCQIGPNVGQNWQQKTQIYHVITLHASWSAQVIKVPDLTNSGASCLTHDWPQAACSDKMESYWVHYWLPPSGYGCRICTQIESFWHETGKILDFWNLYNEFSGHRAKVWWKLNINKWIKCKIGNRTAERKFIIKNRKISPIWCQTDMICVNNIFWHPCVWWRRDVIAKVR